MVISHLSELLIDTVRELGRDINTSTSSLDTMSRIRSSLFTILEDPSLREYLPFIEILMMFILDHPDFYSHSGFLNKIRKSDTSLTGDQIRKISSSLLSENFRKDVLLEEGYKTTAKLVTLFEKHHADISLSDIYDSVSAFGSLLEGIYAERISLTSVHIHMILEAGMCTDKMYRGYEEVLREICELSGIDEQKSIEVFELEQNIRQKGEINLHFWMKRGKENILAQYFRTLYQENSLHSWISGEFAHFGKSQETFLEAIDIIESEEDIDENWISFLFTSICGQLADKKMGNICRSIYFQPEISPVSVDLSSRKPAIFLEYNDPYGYGDSLDGGYYDDGPYIFIGFQGSTNDEYEGVKDHEFFHYLYKNVFTKIRSNISRRIASKIEDQGKYIFIPKNTRSRGFSPITPEWAHVQNELCAYIGEQNIIPTYLPHILGNHVEKTSFSVELMRLIVDLSDILKYYPQGNEDITSIILTSSSMKKLQERLHIKYEYFIENINPSVPILIDKFLQISPEKQILIYPYSIYRDPENCILIDHIDSGVTQVYTNIEDIPETFFHT